MLMEEWRKIKNYEDYYISSLGRIYSLKSNKFRITSEDKDGYKQLLLYNQLGRKRFYIHRLVAQAFIPNPQNKPQVNHIDGDKTNNRVDNLEWATSKENNLHAHKNGLCDEGHKLTSERSTKVYKNQRLKIKKLYKSGKYTQQELANKFNVGRTTIHRILNNKTKYLTK